jgi:hypothetical protein
MIEKSKEFPTEGEEEKEQSTHIGVPCLDVSNEPYQKQSTGPLTTAVVCFASCAASIS